MKQLSIAVLGLVAFMSVACADSGESKTPVTKEVQLEAQAEKNIVEVAAEAGVFKTLLAAAQAADLVDVLTSDGPFTVFAPTDEAFAKLPEGTVESLLKPENKDALVDILLYHVLPGKVLSETAIGLGAENTQVAAANEKLLSLSINEGSLFINDSKVTAVDVEASNGVIHIIDAVLIP